MSQEDYMAKQNLVGMYLKHLSVVWSLMITGAIINHLLKGGHKKITNSDPEEFKEHLDQCIECAEKGGKNGWLSEGRIGKFELSKESKKYFGFDNIVVNASNQLLSMTIVRGKHRNTLASVRRGIVPTNFNAVGYIRISDNDKVLSSTKKCANILAHELFHLRQIEMANKGNIKDVIVLKMSPYFPYEIRPEEIEANLFAALNWRKVLPLAREVMDYNK